MKIVLEKGEDFVSSPFSLERGKMKNGSYLSNPTGLIFFQNGQGWFLSKLNEDDQFITIIGPVCRKESIVKESFNYFQNIYFIDEEYNIYLIEEVGKEILKFKEESLKSAKEYVSYFLKN